jgi:hypothetical protein
MKLLKTESNSGHFLQEDGEYAPIDKIAKGDLLRLVDLTLSEDLVEFDSYDENCIKNQAHQVIYRSLYRKLVSLRDRKQEFSDESARLYLEDYERYKEGEET